MYRKLFSVMFAASTKEGVPVSAGALFETLWWRRVMTSRNFSSPSLGDDQLVATKQAAVILAVSEAFLERDRWAGARNGRGPLIPYVKVGPRAVRYRQSDLRVHIEKNRKCGSNA